MLFLSPVELVIGLFVAAIYGYLFRILTIIEAVFSGTYRWPAKSIWLTYIGIGMRQ